MQDHGISPIHLKFFSCILYIKVKDSDRGNIEENERSSTFKFHGLDDKGYYIWDNIN